MKWEDESSDHAQAHIRSYKEKIKEIEKNYADEESQMTYEQFMDQRGAINRKLRSLSKSYDMPEDQTMLNRSVNTADDSTIDIDARIEIDSHPKDGNLSMNSLNSSINFVKLQTQTNDQKGHQGSKGSRRLSQKAEIYPNETPSDMPLEEVSKEKTPKGPKNEKPQKRSSKSRGQGYEPNLTIQASTSMSVDKSNMSPYIQFSDPKK